MAVDDEIARRMNEFQADWDAWAQTPEGRAALDKAWGDWNAQKAAGIPVTERTIHLFRRVKD